MKLKTLKDMKEALSTVEHPFKEWETWQFIEKIIRQEAIKWVNEHRNKMWNWTEDTWINFFNITEEDLK